MLPVQELEYSAFRDSLAELEVHFELLEKSVLSGDCHLGEIPESMG